MEWMENLNALAVKLRQQRTSIATKEATKNAFVMPFIHNVLGYDVFDPAQVVPEYVCSVGAHTGDTLDYAVLNGGQVHMLVECQKIGEPLSVRQASPLFRTFAATKARMALLTNGQVYQFYKDGGPAGRKEAQPFLELDLLDLEEEATAGLHPLTKAQWDLNRPMSPEQQLQYVALIQREIAALMDAPSEDFQQLLMERVSGGAITTQLSDQFPPMLLKAIAQYTADIAHGRTKPSPKAGPVEMPIIVNVLPQEMKALTEAVPEAIADDVRVGTTQEELEGFLIVKSIVRAAVNTQRLGQQDRPTHFGVVLDDNERKTVCRFHFNRTQKYVGVVDEQQREKRFAITYLDELYDLSDALVSAARRVA